MSINTLHKGDDDDNNNNNNKTSKISFLSNHHVIKAQGQRMCCCLLQASTALHTARTLYCYISVAQSFPFLMPSCENRQSVNPI